MLFSETSCGLLILEYYPNGLKVQFCGGLMGFVSYKHLGVSSEVEAAKQYPPGHYLTVYITWVDMKSQKIELSLQKGGIRKSTVQKVLTNQRPGIELAPCTGGKLWPGDVVNGCFEKVENRLCTLYEPSVQNELYLYADAQLCKLPS